MAAFALAVLAAALLVGAPEGLMPLAFPTHVHEGYEHMTIVLLPGKRFNSKKPPCKASYTAAMRCIQLNVMLSFEVHAELTRSANVLDAI